ncbi:MAG: RNA 2'-phosphotransferase [Bacteroidota bacterium]
MLTKKEEIKHGRFLSMVLRHKPEVIDIQLDTQGWVEIKDLLAKLKDYGRPISKSDLVQIVENNNKKRYVISDDGKRIRASQGHSIDIELEYSPMEPPEMLYHGTADRFLHSIFKTGLDKRKRHHVHLSADLDTASQVGKRHGKLVILKVAAAEMHKAGHKFYCTPNGVWLTESVPVEFLSN